MHEFKDGTLKSGKEGKGGIVKNRKQAIAIGLREANAEEIKETKNKKKSLTAKFCE